jgi:hypothetical protein
VTINERDRDWNCGCGCDTLMSLFCCREGRLMSHYFDVEAYQEMMRRVSQEKSSNPQPRPKVKRKMIEYFKKRKEEKKRKRILNMLL